MRTIVRFWLAGAAALSLRQWYVAELGNPGPQLLAEASTLLQIARSDANGSTGAFETAAVEAAAVDAAFEAADQTLAGPAPPRAFPLQNWQRQNRLWRDWPWRDWLWAGAADALQLERVAWRLAALPDPDTDLEQAPVAGRIPRHSRLLAAALGANPRYGSPRITMALAAEADGELESARRELECAAAFDHQWLPAWTLANFWYRQHVRAASPRATSTVSTPAGLAGSKLRGEAAETARDDGQHPARQQFWLWAGRSAMRTYDGFQPLLALAQQLESDPGVVMDRLGFARPELYASARPVTFAPILGDKRNDTVAEKLSGAWITGKQDWLMLRHQLLRAYLDLEIGSGRFEAGRWLVGELARLDDPEDSPRIADFVERQLQAGDANGATSTWALRFEDLDADQGPWVADAALTRQPTGVGFDRQLGECPGLSRIWEPGEIRFSLDGNQPDTCVILRQRILLRPGTAYEIRVDRRAGGSPQESYGSAGLYWEIEVTAAATPIPAEVIPFSGQRQRRSFTARSELGRLQLVYRRPPGSLPSAGGWKLAGYQLSPATQHLPGTPFPGRPVAAKPSSGKTHSVKAYSVEAYPGTP